MDETRFLSIELGTLLVVAFRRETACVLAGHNNINVNHLVLGSWWYARAASTIFTVLRFARSCLASSYRWAPGRDLRYSAAASKIHQGHFSDIPNNHTSAKSHLVRGVFREFQLLTLTNPQSITCSPQLSVPAAKRLNRSFSQIENMSCRIGTRRSLCKRSCTSQ